MKTKQKSFSRALSKKQKIPTNANSVIGEWDRNILY